MWVNRIQPIARGMFKRFPYHYHATTAHAWYALHIPVVVIHGRDWKKGRRCVVHGRRKQSQCSVQCKAWWCCHNSCWLLIIWGKNCSRVWYSFSQRYFMPPGETERPSMQGCLQALEILKVLGLIDSVVTADTWCTFVSFYHSSNSPCAPSPGAQGTVWRHTASRFAMVACSVISFPAVRVCNCQAGGRPLVMQCTVGF